MNENNFDDSIRAVIAALNEVISVNSDSGQPIQADDLKQVIEKHNIQNIDSQIIRKAYWSVANDADESEFSKYYRAESYLQKGRSLVEGSGREQHQPKDDYENNMPMLDMDALRYRHNNDKESFK
jgi:asparagine synthetase A